ncbi:MAG TPA: hypothetical protein VN669_00900 [Candidatus Acidoferrales bacterium]|nr:hypothetical protein [Candidatus Acidoferrales bacterium]
MGGTLSHGDVEAGLGADVGATGAGWAPVAAPKGLAAACVAVPGVGLAEVCADVKGRGGACVERPQFEQKVVPSGCEAPQL